MRHHPEGLAVGAAGIEELPAVEVICAGITISPPQFSSGVPGLGGPAEYDKQARRWATAPV